MHAVYQEGLAPVAGERVVITGDEARHALRVKRAAPGEAILLLNGAGGVWRARVEQARRDLCLRIEAALEAAPVKPAVRVYSPAPKGPRASDLVDLLSQAGASSWSPIASARASKGASDKRLERLDRVAQAACKQCQRAWKLRLEAPTTLADALISEPGERVILAERDAPLYAPTGAQRLRLLIGPEGGWTEAERTAAQRAEACPASFGPHTLRIEAAAAVAVAIIIHAERARSAAGGA